MVMTKEEAKRMFAEDRFATEQAGITIEEVGEHRAVCRMVLSSRHRNANHAVMGGAIFTLADFTAAVAANATGVLSVTTAANIQFLSATQGSVLIAKAEPLKVGHSLTVLSVTVKDDLGVTVAYAVMDCFNKA